MHLVIGLLATLLALWLFIGLADAVVDRARITEFDVALDNRLHDNATPTGIRLARLFSYIGSPITMTVLMIVVAVALWRRHEHLLLITWLSGFVGGSIIDQGMKFLFHRERPSFASPIIVAHGFSFPSGHAMGSMIGFGLLAYLVLRVVRGDLLRVVIITATTALVLAIGISRLYLGVHFFSDVVAGYAAGTVWLSSCLSGAEIVTWRHGRAASARAA